MKLIHAVIREAQLDEVREALIAADIKRITVSKVSGHGQQHQEELYRGRKVIPNLIPKIKIEIAVNDEFVNTTVETIINGARSGEGDHGEIGDGKFLLYLWKNVFEYVLVKKEAAQYRTTNLSSKK